MTCAPGKRLTFPIYMSGLQRSRSRSREHAYACIWYAWMEGGAPPAAHHQGRHGARRPRFGRQLHNFLCCLARPASPRVLLCLRNAQVGAAGVDSGRAHRGRRGARHARGSAGGRRQANAASQECTCSDLLASLAAGCLPLAAVVAAPAAGRGHHVHTGTGSRSRDALVCPGRMHGPPIARSANRTFSRAFPSPARLCGG